MDNNNNTTNTSTTAVTSADDNHEDENPVTNIKRLERKHDQKQWVQMYANTVRNKLELRDLKIQQRREDRMRQFRDTDDNDDESVYTMGTISVRTGNNRAFLTTGDPKKKVLANLGNKKAADILSEQPPRMPVWQSHWGNQLLCYLCSQPALHSSISCGSCNNIAHVRCLQEVGRENRDALSNCLQCLEQYYADRADYDERMRKLKEQMLRNHCASIIGRRIRVFLERRRFLRKQKAIRKLQAISRGNIYLKRFHKSMRGKLRLVLLQMAPSYHVDAHSQSHNHLEFLNHVLIVITVFDPHKNIQYFRMERPYYSLHDTAITLPGVNYFMTVIFTVAVRDESKSHVILGQTQVGLGDILNPALPTDIPLKLSTRVMWMPQEAFGVKYAHLVTTGRINTYMKHFRENVVFHLRYLPQNPVTTSCQYIHGPPLDILRRGGDMNRLPKHRAANNSNNNNHGNHSDYNNNGDNSNHHVITGEAGTLQGIASSLHDLVRERPPSPDLLISIHRNNKNSSSSKHPPRPTKRDKASSSPSKLPKLAADAHGANASTSNSKNSGVSPSSAVAITAANLVTNTSLVTNNVAPAVPAAGAVLVAAAPQTGNYRASQYWMALYNLRILFYQFHGDIEPRYSLDLQDVHVLLSKDRGRTYSMVTLQFPDNRVWHIEFNDRKSAVMFDMAVHESKKAFRENNSIYMRQDDFSDDVSIGFR